MKLTILGNGFDLHHNYKTSFSDFRESMKNSKGNIELINKVDGFLDVSDDKVKRNLLWNDFESIIGNKLKHSNNIEEDYIRPILEEFSQCFFKYLLDISSTVNLNKNIEEEFESTDVFLSFNYTELYKQYLKKTKQVFHIHGKLSDNDLPIIGFYYDISPKSNTTDYYEKYKGRIFHKPALSLKQNNIEFEKRLYEFQNTWKNKISEIVIIGYSFGDSDNHIYSLLNNLMIPQITNPNMPLVKANKIPTINIKIFNYNDTETDKIISKIKTGLNLTNRKISINVTGVGFAPKVKEILKFQIKSY